MGDLYLIISTTNNTNIINFIKKSDNSKIMLIDNFNHTKNINIDYHISSHLIDEKQLFIEAINYIYNNNITYNNLIKVNNNNIDIEICNDKNTSLFNLNGTKCYTKVLHITDGDTIKVAIYLFNNYYKFNVRLNGIDTCETKSKNDKNKELGIKAKERLKDLIENKIIWIKCYNFDKYGRLLADIYQDDQELKSYSDILLEEKLAYKYEGKTKLTEEEQISLLEI